MSEPESGQAAESQPQDSANKVDDNHSDGRPLSTGAAIGSALFAGASLIISIMSFLNSSQQTKISHDALVVAQRAFVGLDSDEQDALNSDAEAWRDRHQEEFAPKIYNFGKTPAYNVKITMKESNNSYSLDEIFESMKKKQDSRTLTINPGGFLHNSAISLPGLAFIKEIIDKNNGYEFYIATLITYRDAFGFPHETQACYLVGKEGIMKNSADITMSHFQHCNTHNCSDDDCETQKN